jgi:hypothetical protein
MKIALRKRQKREAAVDEAESLAGYYGLTGWDDERAF